MWWRFVEQGRAFSVASGGRLEFNHIAPAIDACVAGLGLGAFLSYQIAGHLAAGRLLRVCPEWQGEPAPLYLLCADRRQLSPTVRQLREFLRERCLALLAGRL